MFEPGGSPQVLCLVAALKCGARSFGEAFIVFICLFFKSHISILVLCVSNLYSTLACIFFFCFAVT